MDSLRERAERYLGTAIEPQEWGNAKVQAERKLGQIIEREGDLNGVRRESWYLAQLIAETVKSERFNRFTIMLISFNKYAEEQMKKAKASRDKKGQPHTFTV